MSFPTSFTCKELMSMNPPPSPHWEVDTDREHKSHVIVWDGKGEPPQVTLCGRWATKWRICENGYRTDDAILCRFCRRHLEAKGYLTEKDR